MNSYFSIFKWKETYTKKFKELISLNFAQDMTGVYLKGFG